MRVGKALAIAAVLPIIAVFAATPPAANRVSPGELIIEPPTR